jgi:hypothetical protein
VTEPEASNEERLELVREELDRLVRRLQTFSAAAWRTRQAPVVAALGRLVEISGRLENRAMPALPDLAPFAVADATSVIGGDLLTALGVSPDRQFVDDILDEIRRAMESTR